MNVIVRKGLRPFSSSIDYTTQDEMEFLRGLGTYCSDKYYLVRGKPSQEELLKKYKKVMPNRYEWDQIDSRQIEEYISNLIVIDKAVV